MYIKLRIVIYNQIFLNIKNLNAKYAKETQRTAEVVILITSRTLRKTLRFSTG